MRRLPPFHALLPSLALFLTSLPLALLAFTQAAWAATVPAPSPGPPVVPFSSPVGDPLGILLSGALVGTAAIAITALLVAVGSRRRTGFSMAMARPALRPMTPERSVDRGAGDVSAVPESEQARKERRKSAA